MGLGSGIRDQSPGSGIRKIPIPDPGSRGQKGPDPDPQHCLIGKFFQSVETDPNSAFFMSKTINHPKINNHLTKLVMNHKCFNSSYPNFLGILTTFLFNLQDPD
jgi:hypothetical protein